MSSAYGREAGQPCQRLVEYGGVQRIADVLAVFFRDDEVGLAQEIEMVGDAREADVEVAGDLADGEVAFAQELEDAAADGVVQSPEKARHDI